MDQAEVALCMRLHSALSRILRLLSEDLHWGMRVSDTHRSLHAETDVALNEILAKIQMLEGLEAAEAGEVAEKLQGHMYDLRKQVRAQRGGLAAEREALRLITPLEKAIEASQRKLVALLEGEGPGDAQRLVAEVYALLQAPCLAYMAALPAVRRTYYQDVLNHLHQIAVDDE